MNGQQDYEVIVLGAGAAGMLAAATAASRGRRVLLLEKNRKVGAKILMSGGTRCNLTHATDARGIAAAFGTQGPFLRSSLAALNPQQVVEMFHAAGVATKTEETGKIFPVSDRALDVQQAMLRMVAQSGVDLRCEMPATHIERTDDHRFRITTPNAIWYSARLIVTTGGQSYPGCGTSGDAYPWMQQLGHTIVTPRPALVPLLVDADWSQALRGITLSDVRVRIEERSEHCHIGGRSPAQAANDDAERRAKRGKQRRAETPPERRGSLLFAHFGLSGPAILDISRSVSRHPFPKSLDLIADFLPDMAEEGLTRQLQERASSDGKGRVAQYLSELLPRRLIEALMEQTGIPVDRRLAELPRHERHSLVTSIKARRFPVRGTLGFEKAEVTAGGVVLDEIDSRDMQSKRVPGLYLAGELLDLDGPIGGYNFQAAFSTGWLAGQHA